MTDQYDSPLNPHNEARTQGHIIKTLPIRPASLWCYISLTEFDSSWIWKPSVTKATPPQSQQSQSRHILDTEVVPFKDCLIVSTVLSLPITARQSHRAGGKGGGRDMANSCLTIRWGLASDERVRSLRSIERRPPGTQSIPHYSESFVEEKLLSD